MAGVDGIRPGAASGAGTSNLEPLDGASASKSASAVNAVKQEVAAVAGQQLDAIWASLDKVSAEITDIFSAPSVSRKSLKLTETLGRMMKYSSLLENWAGPAASAAASSLLAGMALALVAPGSALVTPLLAIAGALTAASMLAILGRQGLLYAFQQVKQRGEAEITALCAEIVDANPNPLESREKNLQEIQSKLEGIPQDSKSLLYQLPLQRQLEIGQIEDLAWSQSLRRMSAQRTVSDDKELVNRFKDFDGVFSAVEPSVHWMLR